MPMRDSSTEELIRSEFLNAGLPISEKEAGQFSTYLLELKKWNKKINLTSIKEDVLIIKKLFVSSANYLNQFPDFSNKKVLDLGSGAGIPGVPVKILRPGLEITLLDSLKKRITFLKHIARLLGFSDCRCLAERAEVLSCDPREIESYDIVFANWVGSSETILTLSLPFLKSGGLLITRKGVKENLSQKNRVIGQCQYRVKSVVNVNNTEENPYRFIAFEKCST